MSTVKATHFEHPSASTAGITLGADGSVVLPAGFTGGLGTNVVQAVKTDTFSTTATSPTNITGLSATITPSSATAKVLIIAQINLSFVQTGVQQGAFLRIDGGNATTYIGDAASNRTRSATGTGESVSASYYIQWAMLNHAIVFLDSPASASAVTYNAQLWVNAATAYINRAGTDSDAAGYPRGASSLTVIEVAA